MSKNLRDKAAFLIITTAALASSFAPVAEATPVHYDFTVQISSGLLSDTTANGSFTYDSSSITPGASNKSLGLLTALDFTLNGITYDANSANTGYLSFNAAGKLTDFWFGNSCVAARCALLPLKNSWFVHNVFGYTALDSRGRPGAPGAGSISYSLAPVPVPEPGTLGLFGLGALLMGLFLGTRRRTR
ncbi:MAG: PEP-CTERM sorting domain-containing protein [Rhodanobacter sp.]